MFGSGAVTAQNLFAPAAHINEGIITLYEVDQRVKLLTALRSTGDLPTIALERLIDERMQLAETARVGIEISDEDIEKGVSEFASRAEMTGEQFLAALGGAGVAPESFSDFVLAGLAWREFVRARFLAKAQPTANDIDRAIAQVQNAGSARVLISELFLPANTPQAKAEAERLAAQLSQIRTVGGFAEAARTYSAGQSRQRGGRVLDWVPVENLPPAIREAFLTMQPGEVTDPVLIPNAIALFQLRAIEETVAPPLENLMVDYAAYYIDGGRSEPALARAAKVRSEVDVCDDLYGIAKGQDDSVLDREELAIGEIPTDIAMELAKLDGGESSTALTRSNGQTLVFLMLCERKSDKTKDLDRDAVQSRLRNERLSAFANAYLAKLKANTHITIP